MRIDARRLSCWDKHAAAVEIAEATGDEVRLTPAGERPAHVAPTPLRHGGTP